jgi:hypothetical protein
MSRRFLGVLAGALVLAALAAPVAFAGAPANVSVRVEGPRGSLASTLLTTDRSPVVKDGTHRCSGTSAAGALDQATGGKWTASWFAGRGYAVDAIRGVAPASAGAYWTLWIDDKPSPRGLCKAELAPGDRVLEFLCTGTPAPNAACADRPLGLIAPRGRVRAGAPVALKVVAYQDDGTTLPAPGAVVTGGVTPATADASGTATVVLRAGESALRATRAGDVSSARIFCVFDPRFLGGCFSTEDSPPTVSFPGNGRAFSRAGAPRVLRGLARDAGVVTVSLSLTRKRGARCQVLDPQRAAFVRCGSHGAPEIPLGHRQHWSYRLPGRLAVGSYTLDVRASDAAGNTVDDGFAFDVMENVG